MRCSLPMVSFIAVLFFSLHVHADSPATAPAKTGEINLTFTQRSPLSAQKEIARRLVMPLGNMGGDYDLSKLPFKAYVPKNYDPQTPCGIFVYLGYKNSVSVATQWEPALDKAHLIFITPVEHFGISYSPKLQFWQALGLALDSVDNLKRLYNVDNKRLYLMSFNDGSLDLAMASADVFTGFLVMFDNSYFAKLTAPNGSYYNPSFKSPPFELVAAAKKRGLMFCNDGLTSVGSAQWLIVQAMQRAGFENLLAKDFSSEGLHYPDFQPHLLEGVILPYLDGVAAKEVAKPVAITQTPSTHPASADAPPSAESEPQHLLKVAKLYADNGQAEFAKSRLQTIIQKYPNTPEAAKAKELLSQIAP